MQTDNNRYVIFKIGEIFFDYDRIEYFDEENSIYEDRFDTIGDLSAGSSNLYKSRDNLIGNIGKDDIM